AVLHFARLVEHLDVGGSAVADPIKATAGAAHAKAQRSLELRALRCAQAGDEQPAGALRGVMLCTEPGSRPVLSDLRAQARHAGEPAAQPRGEPFTPHGSAAPAASAFLRDRSAPGYALPPAGRGEKRGSRGAPALRSRAARAPLLLHLPDPRWCSSAPRGRAP